MIKIFQIISVIFSMIYLFGTLPTFAQQCYWDVSFAIPSELGSCPNEFFAKESIIGRKAYAITSGIAGKESQEQHKLLRGVQEANIKEQQREPLVTHNTELGEFLLRAVFSKAQTN